MSRACRLPTSPSHSWIPTLWSCGLGTLLWATSVSIPTTAQVLFRPPMPDPSALKLQSVQLAGDAVRLAQAGRTDEALGRIQLAIQLDLTSASLRVIEGGLFLQKKKFAAAVETLEKARQLDGKDPEVLLALGEAYMRNKNYAAAVETLQAGIVGRSKEPNGYFQLGNAYLLQGKPVDAKTQFEKAVQLDGKFWPAINNIGLVDYESGNVTSAISRWRKAISLDAKAAEPRLALATALYRRGQVQAAVQLGIAAIKLDSDYGNLETLRQNLWGNRLLADVQLLLRQPNVQSALIQARAAKADQPETL